MNPTEIRILTAGLNQNAVAPIIEKLLPHLKGLTLMGEIPLPLTSRDEWKVKTNIATLLETIEQNGYQTFVTEGSRIYDFYAPKSVVITVTLDLDKSIAFTGYDEGGIPIVIIADINERIMLYKHDITAFQFRDGIRPIPSKYSRDIRKEEMKEP